MKRIIALILALMALLSLASCAQRPYEAAEKSFSAGGMTIKLTNAFKPASISGYAAVYEASDAVVYVSNQKASEFEDVENMSLRKYVEFFCETNKDKYECRISNEESIFIVEYSAKPEDITYKYLAAFFEGNDVYIRVEFVAEEKNYEEYRPYFINWAKAVTVESN